MADDKNKAGGELLLEVVDGRRLVYICDN